MTRILICGPVPEPIGGVSVHIARLAARLANIDYYVMFVDESPLKSPDIFNIRSLQLVKYLKLMASADVVHIHSAIKVLLFFNIFVAKCLLKPTIVTVHSWRESAFKTVLWRIFLKLFAVRLIFVSDEIQKKINLSGLVQDAYVHPNLAIEPMLPDAVEHFIQEASRAGKVICVSNAYKLVEHKGDCLYGLDMCLEMMAAFRERCIDNMVMIYAVANPDAEPEQLTFYKQYISEHQLADNFLLYEGALSFARLLKKADISLRATNTDGDALSVRESLSSGCVTIASDCVVRPAGTQLFKTRDIDDMTKTMMSAMVSLRTKTDEQRPILGDCVDAIVNEYRLAEGIRQ